MKICVVMPAYNEGEGIISFVEDISKHLSDFDLSFLIINDASTDDTETKLQRIALQQPNISLFTNDLNLGHGRSTYKALKNGSHSDAEIVISVDGDGQFLGEDFLKIVRSHLLNKCDVTEGVREMRKEALFRKIVTLTVRIIVLLRSGKIPKDGNTPLRVYTKSALLKILNGVSEKSAIPNIHISIFVRRKGIHFEQFAVTSRPRRGESDLGTTWGSKKRQIPSKKFIRFCFISIKEFLA